jgi:hypothetical protein
MAELLAAVTSWPGLVLVLVVFGFAPRFCLRLIVLAYPSSDPRRTELIAELYAVPRIERPLWVAEQLEVALFEGLIHRLRGRRMARKGVVADRRGRGIGISRGIGIVSVILLVVGYLFGIQTLFNLGVDIVGVWIIRITFRAGRGLAHRHRRRRQRIDLS